MSEETPEFFCSACLVSFPDYETMRAHYKTDWHIYNCRRKVAGLAAISKELWDQKWKEVANKQEAPKGTSHIKEKKEAPTLPGFKRVGESKEVKEREPWKVGDSLFDNRSFDTLEDSLVYMRKKYTFFLPDEAYITDKVKYMQTLADLIEIDNQCIFCGRRFATAAACRQHMLDMRHARIGSENDEIMAELDEFYDYRASIGEYNFKSKEKKEKVKKILEELKKEKEEGHTVVETEDGEGSEDEATGSGSEWEEIEEEIDDEELIRLAEMPEDAEVIHCEDESDFERIMAELGLKPAELLPSGDLCLPSGKTVVHRDMAYIYRQRGHVGRVRRQERAAKNQLMLADTHRHGTATNARDAQLMRQQKSRNPFTKIATRAAKRGQKAIIAVLKRQQRDINHLWIKGAAQGNKFKRRMDANMPHMLKH